MTERDGAGDQGWPEGVDRLLPVLKKHVLAQDAPRAGALVDSYLERTNERHDLMDTITYAACHWQNDPHVMCNCSSSLEEFRDNRTIRRDDIIRGLVKHHVIASALHQVTIVPSLIARANGQERWNVRIGRSRLRQGRGADGAGR